MWSYYTADCSNTFHKVRVYIFSKSLQFLFKIGLYLITCALKHSESKGTGITRPPQNWSLASFDYLYCHFLHLALHYLSLPLQQLLLLLRNESLLPSKLAMLKEKSKRLEWLPQTLIAQSRTRGKHTNKEVARTSAEEDANFSVWLRAEKGATSLCLPESQQKDTAHQKGEGKDPMKAPYTP